MSKLLTEILDIDFEDAREYKDIIFDNNKLKTHFILANMWKTDEYLMKKQRSKTKGEFKINLATNDIAKILFTRKLEKSLVSIHLGLMI